MILELTDEERALILSRRTEQEGMRKKQMAKLVALQLAASYEEWLQNEEMSSTFSVFVNAFGYKEKDAREMFTMVQGIRQAANN